MICRDTKMQSSQRYNFKKYTWWPQSKINLVTVFPQIFMDFGPNPRWIDDKHLYPYMDLRVELESIDTWSLLMQMPTTYTAKYLTTFTLYLSLQFLIQNTKVTVGISR